MRVGPSEPAVKIDAKVQSAWQVWQRRDLSGEDIVRLILDGTCVKVRLDRKATTISILVALGVRRDGQKVLLAITASARLVSPTPFILPPRLVVAVHRSVPEFYEIDREARRSRPSGT